MSRNLVKPELLAPAGNMEKGKMALLYGADAHAVLLAQRAHRRQTFAAAIQPLFNAFCQKVGQMLIARHAVSSVFTIQIIKPVQIAAKMAMQILF